MSDLKERLRDKAFGVASFNLLDDKPALIREALDRIEELEATAQATIRKWRNYNVDEESMDSYIVKLEKALEGAGDDPEA